MFDEHKHSELQCFSKTNIHTKSRLILTVVINLLLTFWVGGGKTKK